MRDARTHCICPTCNLAMNADMWGRMERTPKGYLKESSRQKIRGTPQTSQPSFTRALRFTADLCPIYPHVSNRHNITDQASSLPGEGGFVCLQVCAGAPRAQHGAKTGECLSESPQLTTRLPGSPAKFKAHAACLSMHVHVQSSTQNTQTHDYAHHDICICDSSCMCMCVCVCVCVCVCCVSLCPCVPLSMCMSACASACVSACVSMHKRTCGHMLRLVRKHVAARWSECIPANALHAMRFRMRFFWAREPRHVHMTCECIKTNLRERHGRKSRRHMSGGLVAWYHLLLTAWPTSSDNNTESLADPSHRITTLNHWQRYLDRKTKQQKLPLLRTICQHSLQQEQPQSHALTT